MTSTNEDEIKNIYETATQLKSEKLANIFRCKIFGGGTLPEKYKRGAGYEGLFILAKIQNNVMPVATEVQTEMHIKVLNKNIGWVWVGARNCQNYGLLEEIKYFDGQVILKRGFGMTIKETIGIYDITKDIIGKEVFICERGINVLDRQENSRWSPDLKGVIEIKNSRPEIFKRLILDCTHSVFNKNLIKDTYTAFKSIGCQHFMFECSVNPELEGGDKSISLSINELKKIIKKGVK